MEAAMREDQAQPGRRKAPPVVEESMEPRVEHCANDDAGTGPRITGPERE
jgi:hypothetical protein